MRHTTELYKNFNCLNFPLGVVNGNIQESFEEKAGNPRKPSKMMRYEETERLADESPCAGVRADLKMCLLKSDCCMIDKLTPKQCLQRGDVPEQCQVLRNTFFECKRSLLDNRQRFRGRKGY